MNTSEDWFERAKRLMPGGVSSPVRAFHAVGGVPPFIERGRGCRLIDVQGREYVDYVGAWGPLILGHAHPSVVHAVEEAARRSFAFGAPCPGEVELASRIVDRMPSIERLRFVNSGTEAVMSAVRLARAATRRDRIVTFAGCYHGHADPFLVRAGSGAATLGIPSSPGVPSSTTADTLPLEYNDLHAVQEAFRRYGDAIAAVVVEPVAANMGVVPPQPGFLPLLRSLTTQHGALLIFDEVLTGFRVDRGGAQRLFNVAPDLTTLGKVIGGGLPVGAYGGRSSLMKWIAPEGPVYQAGTMSGNPLTMAAGIATLDLLDEKAYRRLDESTERLVAGLVSSAARYKIEVQVQRLGSIMTVFFCGAVVHNFEEAKASNPDRFSKFFHGMLDRGVYLPPSGFEAWFISLAHTNDDIEFTLQQADMAFQSLQDANQFG